ncbi:BamA/TamA family outer membrane protein [Chitinophagaceae bacterium LWZ2-11]
MRKLLINCCFLLTIGICASAQDSTTVVKRIIFIGDAGEQDPQQGNVIANAAARILEGKTTVVYLGDNVYPKGMGLPGSKEELQTQQILQSQYIPMRSKGAPVYFIPGNHDWDRMGPKGLQKIKQQWSYLQSQNDSLLQLVPGNGCPDPYEINISDSLVIIAFDSEWWLFVHNKKNSDAECECSNNDEIIARLEELVYKNRYKVILLADHHPFQSYGPHGGYFSLKDNLFPLTAVNHNLYIPLPIIGSLYPILRTTFPSPEDLNHPLYKDMIKRVDGVFKGFPNLVHVSGHEHGLQFIKTDQVQIVSGSGAKHSYVRKGKNASFAETVPGYVTADLLSNNDVRFTYYTYSDSGFKQSFTYLQPYTHVNKLEETLYAPITQDSLTLRVIPRYDSVGKFHRWFFGENYRKEYGAETTFPVIKISEIKGGLTPIQKGGGHQSRSLRLKDKSGKEWVLRSVEKYPDVLLPEELRATFARDWVEDNMSAQHPFAALCVPPIANAAKVPHANPIIGVVAPEKELGIYAKTFAGTVCLLEEREPLGKSDNTPKMFKTMDADNDNNFDSTEFLRARLLDLFIGDWDRHEDQWRWAYNPKLKVKNYVAVPRDRDQVFYINTGVLPGMASRKWLLPYLQGFDGKIKDVNTFFFESRLMNGRFLNQFTYDEWMEITNDFVKAMTDSVLETALQRLPASAYKLRHDELLKKLKDRRANMSEAMSEYYKFLNRIVDIQTSNKNELVEIQDAPNNNLTVVIHKINKEGKIKDLLFKKTFDPAITKEIRLYLEKGNDSVVLNNSTSPIKLRIVGGKGQKGYNVINSVNKVKLYDKENNAVFTGKTDRLRKHLSDDSLNTRIVPTNLYNIPMPLLTAGYNLDDGVLFGVGLKYTHQGFRKEPYGSIQQLMITHSFSTKAYDIKYKGEFIRAVGKADLLINATAFAPNNTINFFGRGNETPINKTGGNWIRYYRTRFAAYEVDPQLRWKNGTKMSFSIGPSFQYYHYDSTDNVGRLITDVSKIGSYDSATVAKDKAHAGIKMQFINDTRNNKIFPSWGTYVNIRIQGFQGLNNYSKSFMQIIPEVALFKSIDARGNFVLAERMGGAVTIGRSAFYQSMFVGGQGNLLGYRQYRFAGQHSIYNNLELRMKLANFNNYILPGQFGLTAFYDIGRVWQTDEDSEKWHNGVGGGIYFAPAQMAVLRFVMGHSEEGWYPYFSLGFRF